MEIGAWLLFRILRPGYLYCKQEGEELTCFLFYLNYLDSLTLHIGNLSETMKATIVPLINKLHPHF